MTEIYKGSNLRSVIEGKSSAREYVTAVSLDVAEQFGIERHRAEELGKLGEIATAQAQAEGVEINGWKADPEEEAWLEEKVSRNT